MVFYSPRESWSLESIEKRNGFVFRRIGAPQPEDMARAAGRDAMESMLTVHEDAIQSFLPLVCPTPDVSQHSHAEPMVGSDESPTLWMWNPG